MFGRFFPRGSSGGAGILFQADFSALSLGAHDASTFLSETGLDYLRTTNGNGGTPYKSNIVQTSESTVVAGLGANVAGIGSPGGSVKGLVVQNNIAQWVGSTIGVDSPRDLAIAWAFGGSDTVTSDIIAGPDGITPGGGNKGACREQIPSGGFSRYGVFGTGTTPYTFSAFLRNVSGGDTTQQQMVYIDNYPPAGTSKIVNVTGNTTWQRVVLKTLGNSLQYLAVSDCRNYQPYGGLSASARDIYVDYILLTEGNIAFEPIPTAYTYRYNDRLSYATGSNLVSSGRMKYYVAFYPKGASTDDVYARYEPGVTSVSSSWYLWSAGTGTNDYARINGTSKKLEVRINSSTGTSNNAVSWSAQDFVEIYMELGGSVASSAKYRVNNGSWNDLDLTTTFGTIAPSGSIKLLHNSAISSPDEADCGQLTCWLKEVRFYGPSGGL